MRLDFLHVKIIRFVPVHHRKSAFTLIELILVVAIIAILAAVIFVAVDPARRLQESRNAVRYSDVATILSAVKECQTDNDGVHCITDDAAGDPVVADADYVIGNDTTGCSATCGARTTDGSCYDLTTIGANYLSAVPKDPASGTDDNTDYYIIFGTLGDVEVGACDPEGEGAGGSDAAPVISLSR